MCLTFGVFQNDFFEMAHVKKAIDGAVLPMNINNVAAAKFFHHWLRVEETIKGRRLNNAELEFEITRLKN